MPKEKSGKRNTKGAESSRQCAFVITTGEQRIRRNSNTHEVPSDEDAKRLLAVDTKDVWFTDSAASRHVTYRRDWFSEFHPENSRQISLGDNAVCEVTGTGTILVDRLVNGHWYEARIENVFYAPKL